MPPKEEEAGSGSSSEESGSEVSVHMRPMGSCSGLPSCIEGNDETECGMRRCGGEGGEKALMAALAGWT
jgi:hypothetical protein